MGINLKDTYHAAVIEITGKFLGSLEGDNFRALIYDLKEQGKTRVIVDLGQADLLDSTAIGILIASLTSVRRAGGDMRLANMKKRVRNLFLMTRLLGPVFEDFDSLEEALESFKNHPEPIAGV